MSNKALLDWCVENVEEWNDDFTHIRSDHTGVFYTSHDDWVFDGGWLVDQLSPKFEWVDEDLKTLGVGVITKVEWETSKGINKQSSEKSTSNVFTKDMLIPNQHIVVLRSGKNFHYVGGGTFFPYCDSGTVFYDHCHSDDLTCPGSPRYDIVKVYKINPGVHVVLGAVYVSHTLIWERKEQEKSPTDILYEFELKLSQCVGEGNLEISALTKEFQGIVKDVCKRGLVYKENKDA